MNKKLSFALAGIFAISAIILATEIIAPEEQAIAADTNISLAAITTVTLPSCQWCGKACIRVYPWMACPDIAPPQGYICTEINGKCTSTFGIPTTTTTKQPITTTTTIPTSLPDLTISNITADRITLNIGETTKISATERNIGNKSAGYHNTGIFEDNIETPLSSMEINTIAPGYGAVINANYTCFRAGSHTITVLADFIHRVSTGEVVESNENNNSKTITINCITSPISTTTTAPSTAYIKVISPNGGEQLVGGQTYNITWQSNGVNNVKLAECAETPLLPTKYTCQELSGIPNVGISATLGKLSWYVDPNDPFIPGRVKIKIWDVNNSSIYDQSDNYFNIISFANPKINLVIDPSSIYEGQSTTIIWNVIPIDNISYCRASGGSGDWWGIKAVSGREIIRPIRSRYQDYVLTCIDRDGQSTSASAGVAFLSTTTSNH
jgi:hypothetical protein